MCKRILLALTSCLVVTAGAPPASDVSIRQIKFTTEDQLTRVVIETAGRVPYHVARLRAPDRIYFDLKGLSATTGTRVIPVSGKLLKQIRVSPVPSSQFRIGVGGDGAALQRSCGLAKGDGSGS